MRKLRGKKFRGVLATVTTKRYLLQGMHYWAKDSYKQHKLNQQLQKEVKQLTKELNELKNAKIH